MADSQRSAALTRVEALIARPATPVDGYLDVLGVDRVPQSTAQRVMGSTLLPRIYERVWRPVAFFGFTMRNTADEERLKLRLLDIATGDTVLDLACGPGNTTRSLVGAVGPNGLVVGVSYVQAGDELLVITQQGMILRMLTDDVRSIGRATQGVTIIDLEENDRVVSIARLLEKEEDAVTGEEPATEEPPAE